MPQNEDWVPQGNKEFKDFSDIFCKLANENQEEWNLDEENVEAMMALQGTYVPLYVISSDEDSRSKNDNAKTLKAKVALEAAIRAMGIDEMKNSEYMSDTDRDSVGVHNNAGTDTPAPIEKTSPVIQANKKGNLGLEVIYHPVGSPKSNALPDGQFAVVVKFGFYVIGGTIPTEKQCTQIEILGKSPANITFDAENYGMAFVGYARYMNTRKEMGTTATTFYGVVS